MKVFDSDGDHLETHNIDIDAPESCSSLRENFHEFETASDLDNFILFEFGGTTYDIVGDCYFENCVRISNRGVNFSFSRTKFSITIYKRFENKALLSIFGEKLSSISINFS